MKFRRTFSMLVSVALLASALTIAVTPAGANHTPAPASVTIAGSLQDELGCPADWQPDCAATQLSYDGSDTVWQGTFAVPAGAWEYKAALNDSWDENYGSGGVLNGDNIVLGIGAATDVKFYYDHATGWVTDNVNSVIATAVGGFQSELGCPGDWQPECLRSWMQDADGDGIYEFATDQIPAGSYEGKVALNEAWDVSHPASNLAFTVTADGNPVTFSYDSATNDVTIDAPSGGLEPGDELLVRAPLRTPAADDTMYFVMPDRFINGDPDNDAGGDLSSDPLVNGLLPADKGYFHGGDIAGLEANLGYLDSLGITAIWMTPQFTNNAVQGDGTIEFSSAGYHGYWQIDYNEIDPHFGTNAEMQSLISSAHALGIKVFFDIVANHTGDVVSYEEGVFTYRNKDDYPYTDVDGVEFDDRDYAGTGTFPALDPATSFPYTPKFIDPGDDTVKAPTWLNDPIYYHNRGNSTFTGENSLYGDFFGLDDLFTEHPVVQDGLIDIFEGMITDFGIDGFRLDTVKHVNDEFWEAFVPAIETHASSMGKPDFSIFGEVFSSDPVVASRYTTELNLPAVLDFGFLETSRNFAVSGAPTDALRDSFADDDYFTDENSNASFMPKFTGNHDIGRVGYFIDIANPGADDAERLARTTLDHGLMYFTRGYPVVYYGDEQGFVGDGGDRDSRQDIMPSLVPSYNDDDLIGTSNTTADENLDETHPLYQSLAEFAALREAHVALRQGAQIHRYSESSAGIYAFSRIERTEQVEYIVALNNSESSDSATFATDSPGTAFTEVYPGGGPVIAADAAGDVTVNIPALDFVVYRADANIALPAAAPSITVTAPVEGSEVTGLAQVAADIGGGAYAEVTFAVSADGAAFEPFATDDNAPYAAYYDVADLAAGTAIVFKAIVADAAANLNADKVTVTVGDQTDPGIEGPDYGIIHYFRDDGDYGDHTTGDYNDHWGLHLWGDIDETIEWTNPKPFLGEDEYGRFAWIDLASGADEVGFIVHRGDTKDGTDADRFFDPSVIPEIWVRQDDGTNYTSQAEAQGFATVRYHREDGDYGDATSGDYNDFWGLHLWGDAIAPGIGTDWTDPRPPDGIDDYGAFWNVPLADVSQPVNFIIHRGDTKDPGSDQSFAPAESATVWIQSADETIYAQRGDAEGFATLHYHRPDGDYGDITSSDYNDFWGMHTWGGASDPGWTTPRTPVGFDTFGAVFEIPLFDDAADLSYILHRGDTKDPGSDQNLAFGEWGYEVWQLSGEGPSNPQYVLPIRGEPLDSNRPPVADANGPYSGAEGSPVSLDGTGSTDPDGITDDSIVAYEWDLDNDGEFDDATGVEIAHIFGDNDTYSIGLRVTDSFGATDTDSTTVDVSNVAPTVNTPIVTPEPSSEGEAVTVSATFTDPGFDDAPFSCTVEYGDGSPIQTGTVSGGTCTGPSHVYADDGTHTVEVTVTDKDGGEGSATTSHVVGNVPPDVTVDVESQTVQYSDHITEVTVKVTDVTADPLSISTSWSVDGGASNTGLPDALSLIDEGCTLNSIQTCEWSMTGQITEPEGIYAVAMTVEDGDGGATTVETVVTVLPEDATVVFDGGSPVAIEVAAPDGDSGVFSLTVDITETVPDLATRMPAPGDVGLAHVSMTLSPVGPGSPSTGTCVPGTVTGTGYDAVLPVTCTFGDVPVNTYTVEVTVDGGYYGGYSEDVLVVYDPSLGFTTGGGWFYWPGTDDKTSFGYTMKYNKNGAKVKGSFLLIRHMDDGSKYRVKSNALYGLAIGGADGFGWASFSGKATYLEPGWDHPIGNHEFVAYVEDRGQSGEGDRVWVEMHNKKKKVIPSLSMDRGAPDNATPISGGNIIVPH